MTQTLNSYYQTIQNFGELRTTDHAQRWSTAVLKTLALALDKGSKKRLAEALRNQQADKLADELSRVFILFSVPNPKQTPQQFMNQVARRAGNSDWQFAEMPTRAVFRGLKTLLNGDVSRQIGDALPPAVREVWQSA